MYTDASRSEISTPLGIALLLLDFASGRWRPSDLKKTADLGQDRLFSDALKGKRTTYCNPGWSSLGPRIHQTSMMNTWMPNI